MSAEIAAEMRSAVRTLNVKLDCEYYGLTASERIELRMLGCTLRGWADKLDPGGATASPPSALIVQFPDASLRDRGDVA